MRKKEIMKMVTKLEERVSENTVVISKETFYDMVYYYWVSRIKELLEKIDNEDIKLELITKKDGRTANFIEAENERGYTVNKLQSDTLEELYNKLKNNKYLMAEIKYDFKHKMVVGSISVSGSCGSYYDSGLSDINDTLKDISKSIKPKKKKIK